VQKILNAARQDAGRSACFDLAVTPWIDRAEGSTEDDRTTTERVMESAAGATSDHDSEAVQRALITMWLDVEHLAAGADPRPEIRKRARSESWTLRNEGKIRNRDGSEERPAYEQRLYSFELDQDRGGNLVNASNTSMVDPGFAAVEDALWLREVLGYLTPLEADVVDLVTLQGYPQRGAAEVLGISQPTVSRLYRSAVAQLPSILAKVNGD
jgi:DNA-directed RNA polymerase specialized sigma24 family protein